MRKFVLALLLGVMLPQPSWAEIEKGYLGFAALANNGPSSASACRSYGGHPVVDQHHQVVMRIGRRDIKRSNIFYYGGHPYVTFTIENTTFWGRKEFAILLCHFAR